ncbi:MAG: alpha/beta hydrolase [Desertifilum sp. SIO1I2]|nr:alpha/beta hydrolase [Desertifilum sp. SIO1I2]
MLRCFQTAAKGKAIFLTALSLMAGGVALMPQRASSAERVYVSFSIIERSISVSALEAYAREGIVDEDLAVYTQYFSPEQLAQLRQILLTRIDATPVAIAQFLYSPQGQVLLDRLGQVIQTEARQSGFYALRAALILAAAQPEGLTLLNILHQYPTNGLRVNLQAALNIAQQLQSLIAQTRQASAQIIAQASVGEQQATSLNAPSPFDLLPDVRRIGPNQWSKQTLTLTDPRRNRTYPVDLYLPIGQSGMIPVVAISHGLGSDRLAYEYLAQHLASHGFAVAVPEHLGSSAAQREALIRGLADEVAEPAEFINRPLDIQFLLDELTRLSAAGIASPGQLNLEQVGVLGQSFGGYTALTLGGASINFERLLADCRLTRQTWNVSLTLQCRALELLGTQVETRDPRVKAAIAINPIASRILGERGMQQIEIPVAIVTGSADTVAPMLPEQVFPFAWLNENIDKYLVLLEGGTHFSTLQEGPNDIPLPPAVIGPDPVLARRYMEALSLAFFKTYIANQPAYRPLLGAAMARSLSQDTLPLYLIESLDLTKLPPIPEGAL